MDITSHNLYSRDGNCASGSKNENFTKPSSSTVDGLFDPTPLDLSKLKVRNTCQLSISNSLNNEFRTLSEQEFSEIVEAISTIKTEKTRTKMSRILFYHIASISGLRGI